MASDEVNANDSDVENNGADKVPHVDSQWQDDFNAEQLKVPYSRDEEKQEDDTDKEENKAKDDDKAADKTEDTDEGDQYEAPAPVVTAEDPGEYKAADYSFDITTADGKTHKLATVDEATKFADDHAEDLKAPELVKLLRLTNKMETSLERDKREYDDKKAKFDEQTEVEQDRRENIESLANEMEYLVSKKLIPAVEDKYKTADWQDPDVAKQPGVKEQLELLDYMVKENRARAKAKIAPLTSMVDVFNAWKLEQKQGEAEDEDKKAGEARKAAGAKIAGVSSAAQGSAVPKGIAVGRPNAFSNKSQWED